MGLHGSKIGLQRTEWVCGGQKWVCADRKLVRTCVLTSVCMSETTLALVNVDVHVCFHKFIRVHLFPSYENVCLLRNSETKRVGKLRM